MCLCFVFFFFQAEDGIRDHCVTGVQTCALPICQCLPRAGEYSTFTYWPSPFCLTAPSNAALRFVSIVYEARDRKSTRLNSSHTVISYAVFCLKKKKKKMTKYTSPRKRECTREHV